MSLRSDLYKITTPDQSFDHDGVLTIEGGALILWSPGKREILAAFGQGHWEAATRPGFQRKNAVDRPKPATPRVP